MILFEGKVMGELCWLFCGDKGFGYDFVFVFYGYDEIFG